MTIENHHCVHDGSAGRKVAPPPGPGHAELVARVATRISPGTVTVSVSGRLDQAGDRAVAAHLAEARRRWRGRLVVDLTACDGLGEAALAAVRKTVEHAGTEGFRLSVVAGSPGIRAALDALALPHSPAPAVALTPVVALRVCVSRNWVSHNRAGRGERP
ncbi:STAS domain-containing protein [Amycolatopsis sp. PS_44_ISF1]|uniref:STAS domain-containing protein n=1 Tax=Amycolatopsis sp. PS_44_ISF1 TaxID=2974917 RepID=UPI0028DDD0F6|nr:STAS domain-containing protein [Amycolatopsis sp. PS_44_ISF1]MDT8913345.1 STAS domain-containing protein [Amycolatopsis sp. PS_44_ISF1]